MKRFANIALAALIMSAGWPQVARTQKQIEDCVICGHVCCCPEMCAPKIAAMKMADVRSTCKKSESTCRVQSSPSPLGTIAEMEKNAWTDPSPCVITAEKFRVSSTGGVAFQQPPPISSSPDAEIPTPPPRLLC